MEALAYIEILDRYGRVKERRPVVVVPFSIGRGYSNDIVLDDEFISSEHVLIDKVDDQIIVRDNHSENGVYQIIHKRNQPKIESGVVENEITIRIGHTKIRIRKTPFLVKKTRIDRGKIPIIGVMLDNPLGKLVVYSLAIVYFLVVVYVPDYSDNSIGKTLTEAVLPACLVLMIWAGIWSIASAIVFHENYFLVHLAIVSLFLVVSGFVDWLANLLMFNWPESNFVVLFIWFGYSLVLLALIYTHLRYTTIKSRINSTVGAGVTTLLIMVTSSGIKFVTEDRFQMNPEYNDTFLPAQLRVAKRITVSELELLMQSAKPGNAHKN